MPILKSLIDAGATKDNSTISAEKVRVQNTFALTSGILGIPLAILFYFLGLWEVSLVFLGTTLVLILSLYFNKIGKQTASKYTIIGIYSLILPIYSFLIGFDSGFYIYYAIAPALMLSIFDIQFKQKVIIGLAVAGVSMIITLILGYLHPQPFMNMQEYWVTRIFWINFIFDIVILLVLNLQLVMYHLDSVVRVKKMNLTLTKKNEIIERALQEKDVLLAEIHHRVKNNMAVMSGLMNLQSNQSSNDETKEVLMKNAERIHSMALIHNNLYLKDNLNTIDFQQFVIDLVDEIKKSYLTNSNDIEFFNDLVPISLNVNKAIPCGLIINEILINAIKHAFVHRQEGKVYIQFSQDEDSVHVKISDNGVGFNMEKSENTMGITLINSLTEQLDGHISLKSNHDDGTNWSLSFKMN